MTQRRIEGTDVDESVLRTAVDLVRLVRSPVFSGLVVSVLLVVAGAVTMIASGIGANDEFYVSLQVPHLVSGGFGGVGLVVVGCLVASMLGNRRDEALADEELAAVTAEIVALTRLRSAQRDAS